MNRRQFLVVLGTSAALPALAWSETPDDTYEVIDVGSLDDFEEDKVYDQFRDQGFFIIRRADEVFALSAICTHKGCKVRSQTDQSFLCKCHQSRFDKDGRVLNGPAQIDLPRLPVKLSESRYVLVRVKKLSQ